MATILLIMICTVFIGLGLPDSVFGSAWPAIYSDLGVSVAYANLVTIPVYFGTVTASFFSAKLINKFGTGMVTAVSTALSAVAILGFAVAPSIWWMVILSFPLGAGAGAIDAALNNYVAVHYGSVSMSFLHCCYGVGVALSPFLMSFALFDGNDWRLGYRIVFYIMLGITAVSFFALPLWKKLQKKEDKGQDFSPITLSFKEMLKMPAVRMAWIMFFSTCALEFTCGIWGATFLVGEGLTESLAARILTLYYVGITLGRFVSGLLSTKMHVQKIVYTGYSLVVVAIILLFLPLPAIYKGACLFLIGFGNGPTFPNMTHLTPINFGKEVSQSIVSTQMVACNLGILIMPPVFGLLADFISIKCFPYFLFASCMIMIFATIYYNRLLKKDNFNR